MRALDTAAIMRRRFNQAPSNGTGAGHAITPSLQEMSILRLQLKYEKLNISGMRVRLTRKDLEFHHEEALLLDEALHKFAEARKGRGLPDYSPHYSAYTPVLALALLKAQKRIEYLTWVLIALTVILAALTGILLIG